MTCIVVDLVCSYSILEIYFSNTSHCMHAQVGPSPCVSPPSERHNHIVWYMGHTHAENNKSENKIKTSKMVILIFKILFIGFTSLQVKNLVSTLNT